MNRRFAVVGVLAMLAVMVVAMPVSAQGIEIGAYTTVVTDIVDAVSGAIPGIITALGVVVAGLIAVSLGIRLVRRFAK